RMTLRNENCRRRGVSGEVGEIGTGVAHRVGLRDGGALTFVVVATVINKAAVQARQIIMPAQFDTVGRAGKTAGVAHLIHVGREAGNLLGRLDAVLRGDDDAPSVGLVADAETGVNDIQAAAGITGRPVTVYKNR